MKVGELIELLEECDPEDEVLLAIQPGYPLAMRVKGIVNSRDLNPGCDDHGRLVCLECGYNDQEEEDTPGEMTNQVVWILDSGSHPSDRSPYASKSLWEG